VRSSVGEALWFCFLLGGVSLVLLAGRLAGSSSFESSVDLVLSSFVVLVCHIVNWYPSVQSLGDRYAF
jgi:hypothetical protein